LPSPLPRPVKLLGWTSLFTDAATEAIYPLLPMFVTQALGGSAVALGFIEGAADAISSLLKLLAGRWSDRTGRRKPFVVAGYTIAWLARPLIAFATAWPHVFAIRLCDRVGKGLRGAPRDAMLGELAPLAERGRIFGFHRAMDHTGAVVGPLVATVFLWLFPGDYRTLFALTFIPGALAVAMLMFVAETSVPKSAAPSTNKTHPTHSTQTTNSTDSANRTALTRFFVILGIFTLGNSTDAFLLLRLEQAGVPVVLLPLAWSAMHVVKAGLSTIGGAWSDRYGRVHLIVAGWLLYAVVYGGFALSETRPLLLFWFFVYGVHFALVEGSEKALVADLTPPHLRGASFGWYNAVLGIGALGASLGFGALWEAFGPRVAFLSGATLAIIATVVLLAARLPDRPSLRERPA
jgi:MFS family permease